MAASIAASDPLKAWLDGGCPPEATAALLAGEINAKSIFGPVLDFVFGRGAYSQMSVAATPPGCEGVAEEEWELQMDEECVAVDKGEYVEVPFDIRIMHPNGDRGYEAALEEHMSNLYEERFEECQDLRRDLKLEKEKTEVRRRAWEFASRWLAAPAPAPASYADVAAAIEAVESSEATFKKAAAESAAEKVEALAATGLSQGALDSALMLLTLDELLGDAARGEPSHPRRLRVPLWDLYWEDDDDCWWNNGACESILDSAPDRPGARGYVVGIAALARVVLAQCEDRDGLGEIYVSMPGLDEGLGALVGRLRPGDSVALRLALPAVRAALALGVKRRYQVPCLEDIRTDVLPALLRARDELPEADRTAMAATMKAWLAGSGPTKRAKTDKGDPSVPTILLDECIDLARRIVGESGPAGGDDDDDAA